MCLAIRLLSQEVWRGLGPARMYYLEVAMRRNILRRLSAVYLLVLTTVGVLCAQGKPDSTFTEFFERFKSGVQQKDKTRLSRLMSPNFRFLRAEGVSPDDVFKGLDADNGRGWADLQQAVSVPTPVSFAKPNGDHRKVLQCTPTNIVYSCLVTFEPDEHNQWQWTGMVMALR